MCAFEYVVDMFPGFYSGIKNLFDLKYWGWRPGLWVQTTVDVHKASWKYALFSFLIFGPLQFAKIGCCLRVAT